MILLINASAAKCGGAKTIVEKYCRENSFDNFHKVYILCPSNLEINNDKLTVISKETSGVNTFLFSLFGVYYWVNKFCVDKIISFNNFNCILGSQYKVTYFHQMLVFTQKAIIPLPPFMLKIYLMYLDRSTKFIVQSDYVRNKLSSLINFRVEVIVSWPGYDVVDYSFSKNSLISRVKHSCSYKYLVLVPIVDVSKPHKNFSFVTEFLDYFNEHNIGLLVTSTQFEVLCHPNVLFIGRLSKFELFSAYREVDCLLFPSLEETIGLPIYENAGCGGLSFVLDRPYLNNNVFLQSSPSNVILFTKQNFRKLFINNISSFKKNNVDLGLQYPFSQGNWF